MTSQAEEARHKQATPNEERAKLIEWGLRGRERVLAIVSRHELSAIRNMNDVERW